MLQVEIAGIRSRNLPIIEISIEGDNGFDSRPPRASIERRTTKKRCLIAPVDKGAVVEPAKVRHGAKLTLVDSIVLMAARKFAPRVVAVDRELKGLKDVLFIG